MPKKGDIVLVVFPFTDLSGSKRRPALVVGTSSEHVVVLFITSKSSGGRHWRVPLAQTRETNLKTRSAIRCNKITSVDMRLITGALGKAPASVMQSVNARLKKLLKL